MTEDEARAPRKPEIRLDSGGGVADDETIALGRRAVACAGWAWPDDGTFPTIADGVSDGPRFPVGPVGQKMIVWPDHVPCVPNLRDPRAVGWLLALVRVAWGDLAAYVVRDENGDWYAARRDGLYVWECDTTIGEGRTEAEAIVAALEAAPRREG